MSVQVEREGPLGWSLRSVWLDHHQLAPGERGEMNIPLRYPAPVGATRDSLAEALESIVRRHEVFRSTFPAADGGGPPKQRVHPSGPVPIEHREVTEADVEQVVDEFVAAGIDIEHEFPLRCCLITHAGVAAILLLVVHHIAQDDWSTNQLKREMDAIHAAVLAGRSAALPAVPRQPLDQAAWECSTAGEAANRRALAYWERTLRAMPLDVFPYRSSPPEGGPSTRDGALVSRVALTAARTLAARHRVWPAVVYVAAFAAVLSACTGNPCAAVKLLSANREPDQMADVMSCGFLPVPMTVTRSADTTFEDLVRQADAACSDALAHGYCAFDQAVEAAAREGAARGAPIRSGIVFNYLNYAPRRAGRADTGFHWRTPIWSHLPEDVYFRIHEWQDCVVVELNARTEVMSGADVELFLLGMENVLQEQARHGSTTPLAGTFGFPERFVDTTRWRYLDRTWVDLRAVENCLLDHEDVEAVTAEVEHDGGAAHLVADVVPSRHDRLPSATALHSHALDRVEDHPGALCPASFRFTTPEGRTPRHFPSAGRTYVTAGGRVMAVPALRRTLRDAGLTPPRLRDFCGVRPLSALAERMTSGPPEPVLELLAPTSHA